MRNVSKVSDLKSYCEALRNLIPWECHRHLAAYPVIKIGYYKLHETLILILLSSFNMIYVTEQLYTAEKKMI